MESTATPADSTSAAADNIEAYPTSSLTEDTSTEQTSTVSESDFECSLCFQLYYDPITLECGHTACRLCLHRSFEIKRTCPLCRATTQVEAMSHPANAFLSALLSRIFSRTYRQRKEQTQMEIVRRVKAQRYGIFFSSTPLMPFAPIQLHIFEMRYRTMIARAMQTTQRSFVLVCTSGLEEEQLQQQQQHQEPERFMLNEAGELVEMPAAAPPPPPPQQGGEILLPPLPFAAPHPHQHQVLPNGTLGCLVKILRCQAHADGRSYIEAVGVERVRLSEVRQEDEQAFGLMSCEVKVLNDVDLEVEEKKQEREEKKDDGVESEEQKSQTSTDSSEEVKHDSNSNEEPSSLRRRHIDGSAATSSTVSTSATSSSPSSSSSSSSAASSPASPSLPDLLLTCHQLLDSFCQCSGYTLARLGLMNGGAMPSSETEADKFLWWILRVMPECNRLKHEAMACTNRRQRAAICVELLQESIDLMKQRTKNQVKFVGILLMLAMFMIFMRQVQM